MLKNILLTMLMLAFSPGLPLGADSPDAHPVADKAEDTHSLVAGDHVPDGILRTIAGDKTSLFKLIQAQPSIIIFYRGGWCPYCNAQMEQLLKLEPRLKALGYQILAITPDQPSKLKESLEKHKLNYTLLSDSKLDLARAFGIAYQVAPEVLAKMKSWHIDLEAYSGETDQYLPVPAAYIVDTKGLIHFSYCNPDFKVRVDPDKLYAAAQAALKPAP